MKICFLLASVAAGRDGVADYTLRLAREVASRGHECALLGLHDRFLGHAQREATVDEGGMRVLRLSATLPWAERRALAQAELARVAPDWLSLQFVPYGYQDKGIPLAAGRVLAGLMTHRRSHVMMHEIWIGAAEGTPWRERLIGMIQRRAILRLLGQVGPRIVHTSNGAYAGVLRRYGIDARLLPLFGNFPLVEDAADGWLYPRLEEAGVPIASDNRSSFWLVLLLGSIPPIWPPEPLLPSLIEAGRRLGRRIVLLSAGRIGAGLECWNTIESRYGGELYAVRVGELPAERISELLNTVDLGLAAAPLSLIGKSGVVAAMHEHGLPVVVNRQDVRFRDKDDHAPGLNGLIVLDEDFIERVQHVLRGPRQARLGRVAEQFLEDLDAAESAPARQPVLGRSSQRSGANPGCGQ